MSPIDVERTTMGFPFPAAGAAPRPITAMGTATTIPISIERHNAIALPFRSGCVVRSSFHRLPGAARPAGGSMTVVFRRCRNDDGRHRACEVALHLDAAPVVQTGEELLPSHLGVGDNVSLGVEPEDLLERLAQIRRA